MPSAQARRFWGGLPPRPGVTAWTKTPPWRRRLLERRWWGAHRMSCPEQGSHGDPHAPTQLSLQGVCTCVCVCVLVCASLYMCVYACG